MNTNKKTKSLILSSLTFISLFLINFGLNNSLNTSLNMLTLSIFIIYLIYLYLVNKRFILVFSFIIFYISSNIYGIYAIETSTFKLNELGIYSYPTGSLLLITFAHFVFVQTLLFMDSLRKKELRLSEVKTFISLGNVSVSNYKLIEAINNFTILLCLILMSRVLTHPSFSVGLDRFLYAQVYLSGVWDKAPMLLIILIPFSVMSYLRTKSKKSIFAIFLILLYLLWIGNKFGSFIIIAYIISLPFIYYFSEKRMKNIFFYGLILGILLFATTTLQSMFVYNRSFSENITYINQRVAQQGQLWWKTYDSEKNTLSKLNEISDETDTYFKMNTNNAESYNHGIYKIMRITTPISVFNHKIYTLHSRYAYSTQASIYYYFKGTGLIIFSIISAMLYYLLIINFTSSMLNYRIIETVIYTRLFSIANNVLLQSDFDKLFAFDTLFLTSALFLVVVVRKKYTKIALLDQE